MKSVIRRLAFLSRPTMRLLLCIFFDRKYLAGRHFDVGFGGFIWGFRAIWIRNILRLGTPRPWPTCLTCHISTPANIFFHVDDLNNFQSPGTYFQNFNACIYIGRGSYIAPNVGIITSNHCLDNLNCHTPGQDVVIGADCWIGMNAVVLPGVVLGEKTIVAAGSVVRDSFDGNCLIGGAPARLIRRIA